MNDTHRRIGRVDALPTRAAGTLNVDFELLRIDLHVDLLGLRQHRDRHRRRMNPSVGLRHRHPLHPMNPTLEFELLIDIRARDQKNHLLEPTPLRRAAAHRLDLPAAPIRILRIGAKQLRGEKTRLVSTRPSSDFHHGVSRIRRVRRDHREQHGLAQPVPPALELGQFGRREFPHIGVARRVAAYRGRIGDLPPDPRMRLVVGDELGDLLVLAGDLGGAPGIRVEGGRGHLRREFVEAAAERCKVGKFVHEYAKLRAAICELRCAATCGLLKRNCCARRIRLAVAICHGHDTLHSKHHRVHLGLRQDLNPGLHADAAVPALRDR